MTWIKICGITSEDAVACAIEAGVDALGFVFASSIRQLTPSAAAKLAAPARGRVRCIAVTCHPAQQQIDEVLEVFRPDVLQSDAHDLSMLRLPESLELLPVLRESSAQPELPPRLLFEGAASGSGLPCDWLQARRFADRSQLILAGGLHESNLEAALEQVRPFGVDVSSGVEVRPGMKDPAAIVRFVALVRRWEKTHRLENR